MTKLSRRIAPRRGGVTTPTANDTSAAGEEDPGAALEALRGILAAPPPTAAKSRNAARKRR